MSEWEVGQSMLVEWPLDDGSSSLFDATITAVRTRRKRRYQLRFADGDVRWSKLRNTKRSRLESSDSLAAARPYYIGTTDPGVARAWVEQQLRAWAIAASPQHSIDTYYMCVGGLSGFDGLLAMSRAGARVSRLVLYDRDRDALGFARLMCELVLLCPERPQLLRALFGRKAPIALTADSMVEWLQTPIDQASIDQTHMKLPVALRALYHRVVRCTAYGEDWESDYTDTIPARRIWPCWGHRRSCVEMPGAIRGGHQETLHYNEVGWLKNCKRYKQLRALLKSEMEIQFELSDLNQFDCLSRSRELQVLYLSNADQSSKFISMSREQLEAAVAARCGGPLLLVSTTTITHLEKLQSGDLNVQRLACRSQSDERLVGGGGPVRMSAQATELTRIELRRLLDTSSVDAFDHNDLNAVLTRLHG